MQNISLVAAIFMQCPLTTHTQETHQLGANLEDAVDVLLGLSTFGPTLGEAGE